MVGRPWGQFQGESRSARWETTWRMAALSRGLPIMMDERHALMASIALTLQRFTTVTTLSGPGSTQGDKTPVPPLQEFLAVSGSQFCSFELGKPFHRSIINFDICYPKMVQVWP